MAGEWCFGGVRWEASHGGHGCEGCSRKGPGEKHHSGCRWGSSPSQREMESGKVPEEEGIFEKDRFFLEEVAQRVM